MEYHIIRDDMHASPGEYLFYEPAQKIVLCGGFSREDNLVRALMDGRYLEDTISNFKKIILSTQEHRERRVSRCKGCGSG